MFKSLYVCCLRQCRFLYYQALISSFVMLSLGVVVQAQDEGEDLEEVTVTGSRIVRRDYVSNSPIVTIESEAFEQQTGLNVESYLNQLPEYNPAASPVTTQGDVQITPTNSVGIASISLRGFGPNRSLVLLDGHRPVPVNPLMVTDANSIPSALLQRVETITGGASSVYGADAVGGVTNFITRKDYEGFEFDGQYGITEAGDGTESRISASLGANLADDRGNVTVGLERYEREEAAQIERDIYTDLWASDRTGSASVTGLKGVGAYFCNQNCPTQPAVNVLFGGGSPFGRSSATVSGSTVYFDVAPGSGVGNSRTYYINPDSTIFALGSARGQSRHKITVDGQTYALQKTLDATDPTNNTVFDGLKWNSTLGYASAPQDRYSIFTSGNFDLTDRIELFGGARFAESRTRTLLQTTSVTFGWETSVPYNPTFDSPVNPALNFADPAVVTAVLANPSAYANPNFIPTGSGAWKYCQANTTGCSTTAGVSNFTNKNVSLAAGNTLIGTAVNYHPVPTELAILLNSRGWPTYCLSGQAGCPASRATTNTALVGTWNGQPVSASQQAADWIPNWNPSYSTPPRNTYNTNETWQVEGGVNIELPFRDWTAELYASHGESGVYNVAEGNLSLARYRALTNLPDYGRGASGTGNIVYTVGPIYNLPATPAAGRDVNAARGAFGAGDFTCGSGFYDTYFLGDAPMSQDCLDAIYAVLQTRTEMRQDIVEVNLQGGVYDLPAGEARGAMGYQHRKVNGIFYPDVLQSERSFTDEVIGVYPTGYLNASTMADDFYLEALIPVAADLPYVQKFELEMGARYSIYDETDNSEWTYKLLGSWEVKDWLRLRGGYNRATRSPNLGELFLNPQEIIAGGGSFGDPCSVRANAPFGAGGFTGGIDPTLSGTESLPALAPGQTQAGADSTHLICQQMMGGPGSVAENQFYNVTNAVAQAGGGGFAWILQQGNPELRPEKADTWTAGFVLSSPFENPWLSGVNLVLDWWMVNIEDAIMTYSIDYANYRCFGSRTVTTAAEAAEQAATLGCRLVPRDQTSTGVSLSTTLSYDNQATIETSGFDIMLNWSSEIADLGVDVPGRLGLGVQGTILDYYTTKQSPASFDIETEWKGSLGPNLPGTQAGAYEYRFFSSLSYSLDDWNVALRWRHLPSVWSAGKASQLAIIENNAAVTAGAPGVTLGYVPSTEIKTDSYDILDLSLNWRINETFALRGGITNVLDIEPNHFASTTGYAPGSDISTTALCGDAPGCRGAGVYSLPTLGGYSGGYYDTIGRRFFVGFKASY